MTMTRLAVPTFDDLNAAARRLEGIAHRTPVLRSTSADESTGAQVFFKCENLQRTGAFKFRGAYNTLAQFTPEQRERGVLAFSAGNHAQAIALSARLLDMPAVIVMPEDAPASKMAATREYGAQVTSPHSRRCNALQIWADAKQQATQRHYERSGPWAAFALRHGSAYDARHFLIDCGAFHEPSRPACAHLL